MKSKKLISVFLMLVFSIQLLPLRQIASWLQTSQMTEELVHGSTAKANPGLDEVHKHFLAGQHLLDSRLFISSFESIEHQAEALTVRHADDILTPPPNC
jgi:hypothetical protein